MKRFPILLLFSLLFIQSIRAQTNEGCYRFPTLHENTLIFTAEGDLWKYDLDMQFTQRLTTHHGVESNASISPDGQFVAFSAQYEGPTEVYVIRNAGGIPHRN